MKNTLKIFFVFTVMFSLVSAGDVEDIKNQIIKNNEFLEKINVGQMSIQSLAHWNSGPVVD